MAIERELKDIGANGSELRIGALSTIQSLLQSPLIAERCPALRDSTIDFATPQIRRMATVGGNICWSSPSADTVPPLLAFDAELELVGAQGVRRLALEDFFTGAGSNRLDREVLTRIRVPLPEGRVGSAYQKLARTSSDIAQIGCAVRICVTGDRCEGFVDALGLSLGHCRKGDGAGDGHFQRSPLILQPGSFGALLRPLLE